MKVIEERSIRAYLSARGLIKQYQKQKILIEGGYFNAISLKKLKPNSSGLFYFRINKQYRAIGIINHQTFVVLEIWDHQ